MGWCSRLLCVVVSLTLVFNHAVAANETCASQIEQAVDQAILEATDQALEKHQEALRASLHRLRHSILKKTRNYCPNPDLCSAEDIALAAANALQEVRTEAATQPPGWKIYVIFGAALLLHAGINTALQLYVDRVTATAMSSFITIIGALALPHVGAPLLDWVLPKMRRWANWMSRGDSSPQVASRTKAQLRHQQIYTTSQQLVSQVEAAGRGIDRTLVLQLMLSQLNCNPLEGECEARFLGRVATILAKMVVDLSENYPEIDLTQKTYADWIQVSFARWHLDDSNYLAFFGAVMEIIKTEFDLKAANNKDREYKYRSILRAWLKPKRH